MVKWTSFIQLLLKRLVKTIKGVLFAINQLKINKIVWKLIKIVQKNWKTLFLIL